MEGLCGQKIDLLGKRRVLFSSCKAVNALLQSLPKKRTLKLILIIRLVHGTEGEAVIVKRFLILLVLHRYSQIIPYHILKIIHTSKHHLSTLAAGLEIILLMQIPDRNFQACLKREESRQAMELIQRTIIQIMGNCAGGKSNPHADTKGVKENGNKELDRAINKVQKVAVQEPVHQAIPPSHQMKQQKLENVSDEYAAVGSLQIESAKKHIEKDYIHDAIKESEKKAQSLVKEAVSPIKESINEHSYTFQNSTYEEEVVADENVGSFKNNHVNINFQIRAS